MIALGFAWTKVKLEPKTTTVTIWLALYGAYANWGATLLAAIFGTSQATPLAGARYIAAPWQEKIVSLGLYSFAVAITLCCVLVLWGLRKRGTLEA